MRFDRDKLVFLSLCVLEDVCWRAQRGPVAPSIPVRLALAVLHGAGNGDKTLFTQFWKAMQSTPQATTETHSHLSRTNEMTMAFNGICNSVGAGYHIEYRSRMAEVRKANRS